MFIQVCVCPQGMLSQHALQVVSQHALQQVWGGVSQHALQVSRPTPNGKLRGSGQGGFPGPHPRGKLRGIWPGGCLQTHTQGGLQAHTWGGCLQVHTQGVSRPLPRGWGVSRPIPGWWLQAHTLGVFIPACTEADPHPDGYCCGRYASY